MAKVEIHDGEGGTGPAATTDDRGGTKRPGLVVATRELVSRENASGFFTNPINGVNMNVDASASGTPQGIHNGGDSALWTASAIQGTDWDFTSTDTFRSGAAAIHANSPDVGDIMQLAKGSAFDPSAYQSLTIWINVDRRWGGGDSVSIYGYDTAGDVQVGNALLLENYFTFNDFDVWQKISIDISDFAFSGSFDALRIEMVDNATSTPEWFMDDIQWEEAGSIQFDVFAPKDRLQYVSGFRISAVRAVAGTVADGTMQSIPYDTLLGVALSSGIGYSRRSDLGVDFSITITSLMDFLQFGATLQSGSDGTNTWITIASDTAEPIELDGNLGDRLTYTISDDLSSLLRFRIGYVGWTEARQ